MLVLQKGLILPVPMYGGSYFFIQPKDMADRVVKLRDGMIRKNYQNEHKIPAMDLDW